MLIKASIIVHYCEKFNTNYDNLAWILKFASIISQIKFCSAWARRSIKRIKDVPDVYNEHVKVNQVNQIVKQTFIIQMFLSEYVTTRLLAPSWIGASCVVTTIVYFRNISQREFLQPLRQRSKSSILRHICSWK